VWPRGRVYGAQHGLGNKGLAKMGLSERVVESEEVLIEHQWGTHLLFFFGGGEKQHRWRADNQKVGGRRAREKVDEVQMGG
jgi:hypothetical protein